MSRQQQLTARGERQLNLTVNEARKPRQREKAEGSPTLWKLGLTLLGSAAVVFGVNEHIKHVRQEAIDEADATRDYYFDSTDPKKSQKVVDLTLNPDLPREKVHTTAAGAAGLRFALAMQDGVVLYYRQKYGEEEGNARSAKVEEAARQLVDAAGQDDVLRQRLYELAQQHLDVVAYEEMAETAELLGRTAFHRVKEIFAGPETFDDSVRESVVREALSHAPGILTKLLTFVPFGGILNSGVTHITKELEENPQYVLEKLTARFASDEDGYPLITATTEDDKGVKEGLQSILALQKISVSPEDVLEVANAVAAEIVIRNRAALAIDANGQQHIPAELRDVFESMQVAGTLDAEQPRIRSAIAQREARIADAIARAQAQQSQPTRR